MLQNFLKCHLYLFQLNTNKSLFLLHTLVSMTNGTVNIFKVTFETTPRNTETLETTSKDNYFWNCEQSELLTSPHCCGIHCLLILQLHIRDHPWQPLPPCYEELTWDYKDATGPLLDYTDPPSLNHSYSQESCYAPLQHKTCPEEKLKTLKWHTYIHKYKWQKKYITVTFRNAPPSPDLGTVNLASCDHVRSSAL